MTGRFIGHFEVIRLLGKGAMGEVYLARDTKLNRLVALKTFPPSEAVLIEARLASAVNHPNVAHVYQAEEQYIAMEYVEGETLDALIAAGPLPLAKIVNIGTQVAEALEEAHRNGVIHRDVKPSNIMVTARGRVKVLDFGLARAAEAACQEGYVAGTIAYMSPEQALGETADARSDIFSLGVVLYEMLTGQRPFESPSVSKTIAKILNSPPPPIDDSHPALKKIILRCLEKDPDDRYQTAREVCEDLRKVERGRSRPRSEIARTVAAATLALAVVGVLGTTLWQTRGAATIDSVAVLPFAATGDGDAQSIGDGLAETLINRLSRSGDVRVVSRPTSFAYKAASMTAQRIGRDLRAEALVTGRVTREGDRVNIHVEVVHTREDRQLWGTQYSGNIYDLVRIQDHIASSIGRVLEIPISKGDQSFVRAAMTRDPEAFREYMVARRLTNERTFAGLREALLHYDTALRRDPNFALAHAGIAESYIVLVSKRGMDSREGYTKAFAAAKRAEALDPYSAEVHTLLGDLYLYHLWDWDGADRHFRRAMDLNPHYVTARHWYGAYLTIMGRHDRALEQIRIAQQLEPSTSRFVAAEGRALYAARRFSEAETAMKRALELEPNNKNSWDQLASIYLAQGRIDESVAAFQKSLPDEVAKKVGAAYASGGYPAARRVILERLQERTDAGKYVSPADWAIAYARLGDMDGAYKWLEVMYRDRNETLPRIFTSPSWDPIRRDRRYASLVRKVRFPVRSSS